MDIRFLRFMTTIALWLQLSVLRAEPLHPSSLSEATLKQSLAKMLAVPATQIVEARGYDLTSVTGVSGVVLGRYRESGRAWTFPVLGAFHACPAGTCIALLRLGQAVDRWAPLSVVDLDQPVSPVGSLEPAFLKISVREPAGQARWPVLIVASEVQDSEPNSKESRMPPRSGDRRIEQQLYLISLREGNAPRILHQRTLLERAPESEDDRGRPPSRVGRRIEGIQLGRQGQDLVMHVTERDIDSRYSRCLRPEPSVLRHRLVGLRFEIIGDPSAAVRGGCR